MKKTYVFMAVIIMTTLLIACSSDNENEQANNDNEPENEELKSEENNEENNEKNNVNTTDNDEETNDDDSTDKEHVIERYSNDKRLGDSQEFERSDGISTDHVEITVNSFKLVDELNGTEPENDQFLLVNITLENLLGDSHYGADLLKTTAYDSDRVPYQNEKEELRLEFEEEGEGISTGDMVYDVPESEYYRAHFFEEDYFLMFKDEESKN